MQYDKKYKRWEATTSAQTTVYGKTREECEANLEKRENLIRGNRNAEIRRRQKPEYAPQRKAQIEARIAKLKKQIRDLELEYATFTPHMDKDGLPIGG